ncbi:T9SS type A sorting domain-containing protein [Hydrotalea flava]|uniref:T9SS type A sorting domain-containing protein n=1 Tax=Hydrotalea flava TaxID=714549 RepID=UPI00142F0332|nr:T9SS type A sorting domain-containing protein [Hydrotalea flava]
MRSLDGGVTFSTAQVVVPYVGIRKTSSGVDPAFNNIGVNDFPAMAVDKSGGTHNGRIYAVFVAQQNGNGKAVIELTYSDNQGNNWTTPQIVSIPNGIQSFFPWVCVDQATGGLYIAYYSIDGSGFQTNTYLAISNDGGNTIINQKVSDVSHVTQPINNTIHRTGYEGDYIGVTAQGGKAYAAWMDERNGTWQIYVSEVDNSPVIIGISAFCNSTNYTVSNLPPNASVEWSVSPNGIINVPSTGNPITATKISQGNATISATINGNPAETAALNVSTITLVSSISATMNGGCNNGIQTWYVNPIPNITGATNWNWTVDNPTSGIYIYSPNSPNIYMDVSKGGGVSVTYTDACGETSQKNGETIYSPCGYSFTVYPNPANSMVNISLQPTNGKTTIVGSAISEISIYDLQNNLQRHQLFNKVSNASIDVSNLPTGLYIVEIMDGAYTERHKLQIIR